MPATVLGAVIDLSGHPYYIHWGVIQISAANLLVIVLMVLVFFVAILLPFPKGRRGDG